VETAGFPPRLHDRIVKIAIVRTGPDGTIEETSSTLLNPQRDLGPTHVHGIRDADVFDAPRFLDVAGDVADRLDRAIVIAHNARLRPRLREGRHVARRSDRAGAADLAYRRRQGRCQPAEG
jgi:DNA polymerase-3 subunit epsilon